MDPTCGHCLSSGCTGSPGFIDPECPEHGTEARIARRIQLDGEIATLCRHSLLALMRKSTRPTYTPFECQPVSEEPPQKIIREKSTRMLSAASSKIRRVKLFTVQLSGEMKKPEQALSETQRKVCQYFQERKLRIVFRENWNAVLPEFDVFAVW